jgi:tetratricopeptide (TPR) repeat protein
MKQEKNSARICRRKTSPVNDMPESTQRADVLVAARVLLALLPALVVWFTGIGMPSAAEIALAGQADSTRLAQTQVEPSPPATPDAPASSEPSRADPTMPAPVGPVTPVPATPALPQPAPSPAPSYPPPANTSILRRGTQMIDGGQLPRALALFQDYCNQKPQEPSGYFWMGVCYDEMKNYTAAVQAYRDALARAEQSTMDSAEIRTNLGNALLKQNEIDQAIASYTRALEINPLYGLAELNLGRAFLAKQDFQAALSAFDRCNDLHLAARQLPYYRAKALWGAGRKDEAAAVIQRLLQNFPDGEAKDAVEQEFQLSAPAQK